MSWLFVSVSVIWPTLHVFEHFFVRLQSFEYKCGRLCKLWAHFNFQCFDVSKKPISLCKVHTWTLILFHTYCIKQVFKRVIKGVKLCLAPAGFMVTLLYFSLTIKWKTKISRMEWCKQMNYMSNFSHKVVQIFNVVCVYNIQRGSELHAFIRITQFSKLKKKELLITC